MWNTSYKKRNFVRHNNRCSTITLYGASCPIVPTFGEIYNDSLEEGLETRKHLLVDSNRATGKHKIFNYAMGSLNLHLLIENLHLIFDSLKSAAKLIVAEGFLLENVE